jgi:hypothetical protein
VGGKGKDGGEERGYCDLSDVVSTYLKCVVDDLHKYENYLRSPPS